MGGTGRSEGGTSDVDSGIECSLSKFADTIMFCEADDALEGRDANQRDSDMLEWWICVNIM